MVPLVHDFSCGHDPICSAAYGFPRPDQDRTRDVTNRGLHSLIISLAQRARMDPGEGLNYQTLFAPNVGNEAPKKSTTANAKPEKAPKPWTIAVDEVALRIYGAAFEDRTLSRPGHVDVSVMNLSVKSVQIPF